MPYRGGVQLLPESQRRPTLRSYTSGNSYFYGAVVVGILTLVVSAIFGGYKASLVEKIDALDGQMMVAENARNKDQEKEVVAAAQQSKIMKQLLANKAYWSQALAHMEQMIQSSVTLTRLDANLEKSDIAFQATAGSYAAVAQQLAAFVAATGVDDITVNTIKSTNRGAVEFNGNLLIDAKTLLYR